MMARVIAGCFFPFISWLRKKPRRGDEGMNETDEWHDAKTVFDLFACDSTRMSFTKRLCTVFGIEGVHLCVREIGERRRDIHEICPLDFIFEIFHFTTKVRCKDFEYPSIRILVCH